MRKILFSFMILALVPIVSSEANAGRKPNSDWSKEGLTPELRAAVENYWLFKAVKSHYVKFVIYETSVTDQKPERVDEGDKVIKISYSTYDANPKHPEDSVEFTAEYNSKSKTIKNMTVSQGPCLSDMCGP